MSPHLEELLIKDITPTDTDVVLDLVAESPSYYKLQKTKVTAIYYTFRITLEKEKEPFLLITQITTCYDCKKKTLGSIINKNSSIVYAKELSCYKGKYNRFVFDWDKKKVSSMIAKLKEYFEEIVNDSNTFNNVKSYKLDSVRIDCGMLLKGDRKTVDLYVVKNNNQLGITIGIVNSYNVTINTIGFDKTIENQLQTKPHGHSRTIVEKINFPFFAYSQKKYHLPIHIIKMNKETPMVINTNYSYSFDYNDNKGMSLYLDRLNKMVLELDKKITADTRIEYPLIIETVLFDDNDIIKTNIEKLTFFYQLGGVDAEIDKILDRTEYVFNRVVSDGKAFDQFLQLNIVYNIGKDVGFSITPCVPLYNEQQLKIFLNALNTTISHDKLVLYKFDTSYYDLKNKVNNSSYHTEYDCNSNYTTLVFSERSAIINNVKNRNQLYYGYGKESSITGLREVLHNGKKRYKVDIAIDSPIYYLNKHEQLTCKYDDIFVNECHVLFYKNLFDSIKTNKLMSDEEIESLLNNRESIIDIANKTLSRGHVIPIEVNLISLLPDETPSDENFFKKDNNHFTIPLLEY